MSGLPSHGRARIGTAWIGKAQMPMPVCMKVFQLFGRPEFLRAFHGWCTLFWLPITFLAYMLGWLESVTFVSVMSMVALFLGSFSSWQAARVEVKQDEQVEEVHKKATS